MTGQPRTANLARAMLATVGIVLAAGIAQPAAGQVAQADAVADANDAFGTTTGLESSGIYNESDTRGLSPIKAGNARLDGIYFDPVAPLTARLRSSYGIRVGAAAIAIPFPAPTGIVDNKARTAGNAFAGTVTATRHPFGGSYAEVDVQMPLVNDRVALTAGAGLSILPFSDGGLNPVFNVMVKPVIRFGGAEVSAFYAPYWMFNQRGRPVFVTTGTVIPPLPPTKHVLNQTWAKSSSFNPFYGATARVPLAGNLLFRGGLFYSGQVKTRNYTEVFRFTAPGRLATHSLISDPRQQTHSLSGEGQLQLRLRPIGALRQRVTAAYRARDRHTESGGSSAPVDFGVIDIFGYDPEPEPRFTYSAVNVGRVRQSALMLAYQAALPGVARSNLGLQKVRYSASFLSARSGEVTTSQTDTWVYNALFGINLSRNVELFAGTETGLEDSGAAPDNALNRGEQLPTTRSVQYEAGVQVKAGKSNVIASVFQITRPYFSFDAANRFTDLGTARYRGLELSLTAHLDRLTVIAGGVYTKAEVSGPARDAGLVGARTVGTPDFRGRIDAHYRTSLLGELTPTVALTYIGRRALGAAPLAALGGLQSELPPGTTVDLGLRNRFVVGKLPLRVRVNVYNVFDQQMWKVVAGNTLQVEERRRLVAAVSADF